MYKQLTLAQRYVIYHKRTNGDPLQSIADYLNLLELEAALLKGEAPPKWKISVSTISRELKRNRTKTGKYNPKLAHEMAMEKRERIVRHTALAAGVLEKAIKLLKEKRWSPEQISGYLKKQGDRISKERIYQEIRMNPELAQYCHHKMKYRRHQAKAYKTAGKTMIPDRVSIHERPKEADGKRFGDWEMDLVIGAEQKSAVLTVIERSKNMFMQCKLPSKRPEDVAEAVIRLLLPFKQHVHTITTDNGIEFRNHKAICKALGCTVYFADPYCSGQKGAIENMNRYLGKFSLKALTLGRSRKQNWIKCSIKLMNGPEKN